VRVLFVCLGNICRSPTAEGTMRTLVREAGLEHAIELDSAGTGNWHVGSPPDPRAVDAASARGVTLEGTARTVRLEDFDDFDLLVAMDRSNMADLLELAPDARSQVKVKLLREFDPAGVGAESIDVPDPYYGADGGFDEVLDLVQAACAGLLAQIRASEPA
jgi:protein-tyrosine phosphatase